MLCVGSETKNIKGGNYIEEAWDESRDEGRRDCRADDGGTSYGGETQGHWYQEW